MAILAIGNPVAFDANADDRDTRGFISMITRRPLTGSRANCTFEPPVSTPTRRMQAKAALRISWYSTSVNVCAGATVIESPVCTPIGSTFSIEQMITQLSARSRITSSSNSFHPAIDCSMRISLIGLAASPADGEAVELLVRRGDARAAPAEDVGGADDRRQPDRRGNLDRFVEGAGEPGRRHVEADPDHRRLELLAVFRRGDRRGVGPEHLRLALDADHAESVEVHCEVETGLSAERREHGVGSLSFDDRRQYGRRERLDVGAVGDVRVGHDRRRIRVGEDDAVALLAQDSTRLGSGVVELACLTDHDRAGADDEHRGDVVAPRHQGVLSSMRAAKRSNR